jgi:hypothetical protein
MIIGRRFAAADRAGVSSHARLPLTWDAKNNLAWKVDLPGSGWSSPIVWGRRVFVTAAVSDAKPFDARKGLYITDLQGKAPPGAMDLDAPVLRSRQRQRTLATISLPG